MGRDSLLGSLSRPGKVVVCVVFARFREFHSAVGVPQTRRQGRMVQENLCDKLLPIIGGVWWIGIVS